MHESPKDEHPQTGGHPTHQGGKSEDNHGSSKIHLSSKEIREHAREWNDDHIRNRIGSDDPRNFSSGCTDAPTDFT